MSSASENSLKSQRVSVFSRDKKGDSQNQFIRLLRIVISQNKPLLKTGRKKKRRNRSLRKGYRTSIFSSLLIVSFLWAFSYPFPSSKRHFMTSIVTSSNQGGTSSFGHTETLQGLSDSRKGGHCHCGHLAINHPPTPYSKHWVSGFVPTSCVAIIAEKTSDRTAIVPCCDS